jgi:hypothetical protein
VRSGQAGTMRTLPPPSARARPAQESNGRLGRPWGSAPTCTDPAGWGWSPAFVYGSINESWAVGDRHAGGGHRMQHTGPDGGRAFGVHLFGHTTVHTPDRTLRYVGLRGRQAAADPRAHRPRPRRAGAQDRDRRADLGRSTAAPVAGHAGELRRTPAARDTARRTRAGHRPVHHTGRVPRRRSTASASTCTTSACSSAVPRTPLPRRRCRCGSVRSRSPTERCWPRSPTPRGRWTRGAPTSGGCTRPPRPVRRRR